MIDWSSCTVVERDAERVSGAWVFRGTRIPVAALFENLEDCVSLTEFADQVLQQIGVWFCNLGAYRVHEVEKCILCFSEVLFRPRLSVS